MSRAAFVAVVLAAVFLWRRATCFNVDTTYPLLWSGRTASYFGYTVALRDLGGGRYRLVVGAPRDNSSYITHRRLVEPGAVYQCDPQSVASCEQLALHLSGNVNHTLEKTYVKYQAKKDYGWIGGSIGVQQTPGSPMVVCAPRWKNSIEPGYYLMNGMCYLSKADSAPDSEARILYPLSDPYLRAFPPRPSPDVVQRFYYAYGEAGLSAHFTKTGTELLIGAPGVFDWAGTVAVYRNIKSSPRDVRIPNPFYSPSSQNPHDYFGYAVNSGVFFRRPREASGTLYVGGAPRAAGLRGKVLVFTLPRREDRPLDVRVTKVGEQLGEYFGSSLCVVDVNSDGLDDLLVGAPRHSLVRPGKTSWDEGRVYVFLSQDQGRLEEVTGNDKIVGDGESGAHFGTSIASMGDINMDGYPDVAVGAPYGGVDKRGAVFIYHGRRGGVSRKYSQRILASDINNSLQGFGISVSDGMDIDGNSYNDLAVGAYQSAEAVVLRARPIAALRAELGTDVKTIGINASSFHVESCISYSGEHVPSAVDVHSVMVVDPVLSRAYFPGEQDHNSNKHTEDVIVFGNSTSCKNFTVNIKAGQKDFSKPINIQLDYSLQEDATVPRRRRRAYQEFCKDCPMVDPSQLTSVLLRIPFATGCRQDDVCRTDLRLHAELFSTSVPLVLGNQSTVSIVITVESRQDPAFLARVLVEAPRVVAIARIPSSCHKDITPSLLRLHCDVGNPLVSWNGPRNITVELNVEGVPADTQELVFNVTAMSTSHELRPTDNAEVLVLQVRTLSDIRMFGMPNQDTLYFSKVRSKDSDIEDELTCVHSYQVRNYGPSKVDSVHLTFRVPVAVTVAEKTIIFNKLYQPKALLNGQPFSCSASHHELWSDGLISAMNYSDVEMDLDLLGPHRKRRAATGDASPAGSWEATTNGTLYLDCSESHVSCATVTCSDVGPFPSMQTSATVQLLMRVRAVDLAPILGKADIVLLLTSGTVSYQSLPNALRPPEESAMEKIMATVFLAGATSKGLETWVLVLAIMAGLLLFLLLVLGLVKAGFFRRSKKEALEHWKTKSKYDDDDGYAEREAL